MSRVLPLAPVALLCAFLVVPAVTAGEKVDENATPRIVCVTFFKTGDAASGKLESAFLGKMRTAYAPKNVLFLHADLTTPATTHQARLLLNALGFNEVWTQNGKKPGRVLLIDGEYGDVRATLTDTTSEANAKKAFEAALKPPEEEKDEDD